MRLVELEAHIFPIPIELMDNPTKWTVIDQIAQNTSYKADKERVSNISSLVTKPLHISYLGLHMNSAC